MQRNIRDKVLNSLRPSFSHTLWCTNSHDKLSSNMPCYLFPTMNAYLHSICPCLWSFILLWKCRFCLCKWRINRAKFEGSWAKLTPSVTSAAMLGWFLPSSIPVSGLGGNSLTGSFIGSIFSELSHFPTPPAMTSQFWLLCFVWHFGLFLTLTLGQIGWQGKKSGYFKWERTHYYFHSEIGKCSRHTMNGCIFAEIAECRSSRYIPMNE